MLVYSKFNAKHSVLTLYHNLMKLVLLLVSTNYVSDMLFVAYRYSCCSPIFWQHGGWCRGLRGATGVHVHCSILCNILLLSYALNSILLLLSDNFRLHVNT